MSSLATYHVQQMERLSSDFFEKADGFKAVALRTEAVDDIVRGRFEEIFSDRAAGIAAVAVGGYGRCEMFPHSDVDLLLLFDRKSGPEGSKDQISELLAALWDSKLRVSHSVRDPRNCTSLARDNTELHISLLDTRFVAGDRRFFDEFRGTTLPRFYLREQKALLRSLADSARKRHHLYEQTIYHLEPNVKEGPGGLRDYHLACWISQLDNVESRGIPASEQFLPSRGGRELLEAKRFLFDLRCYLHYFYGRDKNVLSYDMQDSIASAGQGRVYAGDGVAELMRAFFRSTRCIHRLALRLMDESAAPRGSLLKFLRRRKSRLSNRDFSVSNGQIYFKSSHAIESRPEVCLRLFEFQARHGLPLAPETETRVRDQLPAARDHFDGEATHWPALREILTLPHGYLALESMRESGVLYSLLPDFALIDCLVIRDFYHRFTVDEHTLVAIRVLKELPRADDSIDQRYARLLAEVEQPELLFCALLFHDVGKGAGAGSHDKASAEIAERGLRRVGLADARDRDAVLYLVREHLSMSEVMTKRDLSEPAVLEGFKARVKTLERLRLLTLMTYADTVAVNPTAMTDWRKDLLWRLYLGVFNVFQRDHEDRRIQPGFEEGALELASDPAERQRIKQFLRGLPERYLRTHTAEEVRRHARLAGSLRLGSAAVRSTRNHGGIEIVVLSWERPFLFASLCAALSSFGCNIEHAEACSNDDGLIVDAFRISGPRGETRGEMDRKLRGDLERCLRRVAEGSQDVRELPKRRQPIPYRRLNAEPAQVSFDNRTSERATIFYVQAPDRSGLLYDLSSVFSQHECDIDVVLCQTQGHRAIDVFYVREAEEKVSPEKCRMLQGELLESCGQGSL